MPHVLRADVIAGDQDALLHVAAAHAGGPAPARARVQARGRGARRRRCCACRRSSPRRRFPWLPSEPCSPRPRSPGAPSSRRRIRGTSASTGCPCIRARTRSCARSAPRTTRPPGLRLGPVGGPPDRHPVPRRARVTRSAPRCGSSTPSESDRGPYPIPASPRIEGGSRPPCADGPARHLPPLRALRGRAAGSSLARGQRRDLRTCARTSCARGAGRAPTRPACRSSPASPATTRSRAGEITHALRFTVSRTRRAFVFPARHFASSLTDPDLPAMGQRLRLKRSRRHLDDLPRQARVVATALQRYGMLRRRQRLELVPLAAHPTRAGTTTPCARSAGPSRRLSPAATSRRVTRLRAEGVIEAIRAVSLPKPSA